MFKDYQTEYALVNPYTNIDDFPVPFRSKPRTIIKPKKIGRNEPCPCGSGKKYKRCCALANER